jgi:hypothetical protein
MEKEKMLKVTNEVVVRRFMKMQGRRFDDYVEKEEMMKVINELVVRRFMKMQDRRFDDED